MNFKELKELIEIVSKTNTIEEFEVERAGVRLRIRRSGNPSPSIAALSSRPAGSAEVVARPEASSPPPAKPEVEQADVSYITSPMVGTFYRASSPDAEPFVTLGDFVEKGSVVCIVEAMKLMNEIESDVAGEVISIPIESGHPVEFGERLFAIRPR